MARGIHLFLFLVLLIGLSGCQSFNVRTDWDPAIEFQGFQSYFWFEPPTRPDADPFADNTLLRKRIRLAAEDALAERGFRAVEDRTTADFLVTYSVVLEERLRVDTVSAVDTLGYRRNFGYGHIYGSSNVRAFQESTLILDFLDPATEDLVWRGWGTGIVRTRDRGRGSERLEQGIRAILDAYPPHVEE